MKTVHKRFHSQHQSPQFTDFVMKAIEAEGEQARRYLTAPSDDYVGQVWAPDTPSHVVHWREGRCTCLAFQD
jgi:hypothetical protein